MKPGILLLAPLRAEDETLLAESYSLYRPPSEAAIDETVREHGPNIRAVITTGRVGVSPEQMTAMPELGIVLFKGAGYEGIDLDLARQRGVAVVNGAGTNAASVADHALGLMLAAARGIVRADRQVREGGWTGAREMRPMISDKRLGIVGLGRVGSQVAKRAIGFDMRVSYHGRAPKDVPYEFVPTAIELARSSDFVVLSCPGGPATAGLVDRAFLEALGPAGFLVNVARSSVVVTKDLVEALIQGSIAGAAVDLWEGEPEPVIPESLIGARNVVFTPHIAARSPETADAAIRQIVENLSAHFRGDPLTERVA